MNRTDNGQASPPILVIALDAAEIELVDQLCAAGDLPNIAKLRQRGLRARLTHEHGGLQSSVWRSFYTGQRVARHGCYFPKMWRPENMRMEFIDETWPAATPIWSHSKAGRPRIALIDVPYLFDHEEDFNGVVISGWQCHDVLPKTVYPASLGETLQQRFGPTKLVKEYYGRQTPALLEETYQSCIAAAEQIA
ncbi:MAG: alkaline phosphatase family protein, partial [Pseudomonadota bacterium]